MNQINTFNSPNSREWLSSLLSYFMSIKSIDDNIESLRNSLCSEIGFTPNQLFHYLDLNNKDFLLLGDFITFLNEMQIPFEEKYVRKFIHNFDKDNDFCLNFQEFLGLILPKKNIDLKNKILLNINNKYISDIISQNSKNIFGKLLCEELELVKNCIKTAKFCRASKGFTCYLGFIEIAGNNKYITENLLFDFLKKNNINISTNDMHQLMFRVDADDDGRISFNEFEEIFFPMKEGELTYKNNNLENENNYNFYTVSSLSEIGKKPQKVQNTFNYNNIDFTFGQNQKINIGTIKSGKMNETPNNSSNDYYNYPNNNNDKQLLYDNKTLYSKVNRITKSYGQLPSLNRESKSFSHSFLNNTNNTNNTNENQFSSTLEKTSSFINNNYSLKSPPQTNRLRHNQLNYKSPKIKHTNTPLHYDYSTFSDEDGDEYFNKRKYRQSAKTDKDRNYRIIKNYEKYETKITENNNLKFNNKNSINIKPCCGCPVFDSLCPCPISVKSIEGCICPKNNKNNLKLKNSYKKSFNEEIKKNTSGFNTSLNSQFFKTKPQFNFTYNNENENIINERQFDEKRLKDYKMDQY